VLGRGWIWDNLYLGNDFALTVVSLHKKANAERGHGQKAEWARSASEDKKKGCRKKGLALLRKREHHKKRVKN